ncbi:hypothetical protein E3E35_07980 [Thermococcus sp. GR7]|uniref:hypothetical protein n=1 Tax=unclassified Thermococcus TaxID=2627626 RepID=UPI001430309A|nr:MULTISPECIES: hypothetical protein [unclassified Thermococcus]NJE47337.1 hypothetical protein [Thermococcus sp. GR7]NJE79448.1 hypothetical protein [Thermococcus sp. GR4]NJF23173.1 hypothetical protein [Thermococcus sp. GR5]
MDEYEAQIKALRTNITLLKDNITKLQALVEMHKRNEATLEKVNKELEDELAELRNKYNSLQYTLQDYQTMEANYEKYYEFSRKYFVLQDFLESVLTSDQELALKPHVLAAVSKPEYTANSLADLTKYVADHVEYAQDQPVPLPPSPEELKYGSYHPRTAPNVFLLPSETIEKGYGDCDDINTLLAAMVKVYFKDVYGHDYTVLLVAGFRESGSGHLFVMVPVKGGKLAILDASGSPYWTGKSILDSLFGSDAAEAKPVREAWDEYMDRLGSPFDKVEVYYIDFYGDARKMFEGNPSEMLDWLEDYTS